MFTIDASVWVSAGTADEPAHKVCRSFLDQIFAREIAIALPTLLTVEIAATISRRKKIAVALAELNEVLQMSELVRWAPLDENFAERAAQVALKSGLRGGDAVYAGVAIDNGFTLISLDEEHLKLLNGLVVVQTPEQALIQMQDQGS
jgi:predicted nucleic acid-binding protein